jgi:hypothetical protein
MLGTITSGPGFLPSSAADMPCESELCKTITKAIEVKRNSAATKTSPTIRRSNPLHGGFSAPGLITTADGETTGGSISVSGTT